MQGKTKKTIKTSGILLQKKRLWIKDIVKKIDAWITSLAEKPHFFYPLILLFAFVIISSSIYFENRMQLGLSAYIADNILRPTIGSKATIALESFFFGLEDNTNKMKYQFIPPDTSIFTPFQQQTPILVPPSSQFSLPPIHPITAMAPIPGEGIWTPLVSTDRNIYLAKTFVRPDRDRSYAITALVKMNMAVLSLGLVAGTREPGGPLLPGPGEIPQDIQNNNMLIAAFNGGFQRKDGFYGMQVGKKTYVPLQNNLATILLFSDTKPNIILYNGQKFPLDVIAIRQNGPMLIDHGKQVTSSAVWNMQTWGLTTTNSMYTWRSGLGITSQGDLIYASGPSLVPETLAKALLAAGAVNAMQLDINPFWVRFVLYNIAGNGKYNYFPLETSMVNGGYQYLTGYQKDFFYVYKNTAQRTMTAMRSGGK